jgi:hypothetical protein
MPPLARDFLVELGRHRREQPRALPVQFRPIAREVVGPRRVMVSSDPASRRALRRVGKVAATTDDVIHLDRAPAVAPPELIAHELAHIAHPSPTPRFFADPVRGPEERQADEIARVMRAAPVLPRVAGAGDADRASSPISTASATTVQRSTSSSTPPRPATTVQRAARTSGSTVTAADLAARLTRSTPTVQRFETGTVAPTLGASGIPGAPPVAAGSPESPPPTFSGVNTTDSLDQFQRLVEMLEERIIVELERRGGRFRGGF